MPNTGKPVAIIGAGVIGLTSGIRLLEAGFAVTVIADEFSPNTTSDVAAAYWLPTGEPKQRVEKWGRDSFAAFQQLSQHPETGVVFRRINKLSPTRAPEPVYRDILTDFERFDASDLPLGYAHGMRMTIPVLETPRYMPYLVQRLGELGGTVDQRKVDDVYELVAHYPLIVNCAGAWASQIRPDPATYVIRGQVVVVRKPAGLSPDLFSTSLEGHPIYIVPRQDDCVLGGTQVIGDWNLAADMPTADAILERCAALNPMLRDPEIIDHRVGFRPGRSEVRLEVETLSERAAIVHNYGHGEDGHGMAWGCAAEVTELVIGQIAH